MNDTNSDDNGFDQKISVNDCSDLAMYSYYPKTMASVYIALSSTSFLLNVLLIVLVCRSRRMIGSPKYWLVVAISIFFILQASVANTVMTVRRLTNETSFGCTLWRVTVVYSNYLGVALVSWSVFLIQLDFLACVMSAAYTRYHRVKVTSALVLITWSGLLGIVISLAMIYGESDDSATVCTFGLKNFPRIVLTWSVLYPPIILGIMCCCCVMIIRGNSKLQRIFGTNTDIVDSLNASHCPVLPPSDHLMVLLLLIILYLPHDIVVTLRCPSQERVTSSVGLTAITALIGDNAGTLLPFVWFAFEDMRIAFLKLLPRRRDDAPTRLPDTFESSDSEFRMYDSYPYCENVQS